LFVEGDEALEDVARFVGHSQPSTTARYVKRLGHDRERCPSRQRDYSTEIQPTGDNPVPVASDRDSQAISAFSRTADGRCYITSPTG
jgi:hypothetical protein